MTGGTGDQNMAAQLNADLQDTLNSHETFLAMNPCILPAGNSFQRNSGAWQTTVLVANQSGPNPTRASMGLNSVTGLDSPFGRLLEAGGGLSEKD